MDGGMDGGMDDLGGKYNKQKGARVNQKMSLV
jgi:hypothetical protein